MVAREKEVARGKWQWDKDGDRRKTHRRDSSGSQFGIRIESTLGLELGLPTLRCEDHPRVPLTLLSRSSQQLQAYRPSITPAHVRQFKDGVGPVCIEQSLLVSSFIGNYLFGEACHAPLARMPTIGGGKGSGHKIAVEVTD